MCSGFEAGSYLRLIDFSVMSGRNEFTYGGDPSAQRYLLSSQFKSFGCGDEGVGFRVWGLWVLIQDLGVWGVGVCGDPFAEVPGPFLLKGLVRVYVLVRGLFGWFGVWGLGFGVWV